LSIFVEDLRNRAKLRSLVISGPRSEYISPFSSKNANPVLGLALNLPAPANINFFCDFLCNRDSVDGYDCKQMLNKKCYQRYKNSLEAMIPPIPNAINIK